MKEKTFLFTLILFSVLGSLHAASTVHEGESKRASLTTKDYSKEFEEERKEAEAKGEARGEAKGEEKGRVNAAFKIARNMRDKGLAPELIAITTELPLEEVRKLFSEKK